MTSESSFKALKLDNFAFYLLLIASFDMWITHFYGLFFLLKQEKFWPLFGLLFVITAFAFKGDNTNDNLDKSDTWDAKSNFCNVCNITFVKSSDLKRHKSIMHQKEAERIETEHESDLYQQKLKQMSMEIDGENNDTDYYPEDDELSDEQGNLTKEVDNKTIRTFFWMETICIWKTFFVKVTKKNFRKKTCCPMDSILLHHATKLW